MGRLTVLCETKRNGLRNEAKRNDLTNTTALKWYRVVYYIVLYCKVAIANLNSQNHFFFALKVVDIHRLANYRFCFLTEI